MRSSKLAAGEHAFILMALIPNRKGQPLLVEWQAAVALLPSPASGRGAGGEGLETTFRLEPLDLFIARAGLKAESLANRGAGAPLAELQAALPQAVQTMQTMPTPENQPAASPAYQLGAALGAADLRMASVARNAAIRRQLMIVAGGLCVLIALYAKVRGNSSEFVNPQEELAATQLMPEQAAQEPVPTAPLQNPQADPVEAAPVQVATAPDTAALPTPVPNAVLDGDPPCKPEPAGADLQSWTPSYKRKSDSRLFVISQEGGTVCITDASGKARLINLKPKVGHAFSGKPPYTVRSVQLDQFEMYLQGIRVKVPSETEAMKLIATELSAPEPDDQYLAAEQPDT